MCMRSFVSRMAAFVSYHIYAFEIRVHTWNYLAVATRMHSIEFGVRGICGNVFHFAFYLICVCECVCLFLSLSNGCRCCWDGYSISINTWWSIVRTLANEMKDIVNGKCKNTKEYSVATCPLFGGSCEVFSMSFVDRRNEFGRNRYNITAKINSIDIITKLLPSSARWALGPDRGTFENDRTYRLLFILIFDANKGEYYI